MNATAPPRAIRISVWEEIGAGEGIQTSDPNLAKVRDVEFPVVARRFQYTQISVRPPKIPPSAIDVDFRQSHFPAYPLLTRGYLKDEAYEALYRRD
jgi:hypothetical protein